MYLEKDLHKSLASKSPGVCFVCGSPNSAAYLLNTKPTHNSEPYFPFLENHDPPVGCKSPRTDSAVLSCYVCYRFLLAQWDSYENSNTPYSTRLYWLKRVDQGPYSGTDGSQQEYRQQATGSPSLTHQDHPQHQPKPFSHSALKHKKYPQHSGVYGFRSVPSVDNILTDQCFWFLTVDSCSIGNSSTAREEQLERSETAPELGQPPQLPRNRSF